MLKREKDERKCVKKEERVGWVEIILLPQALHAPNAILS